MTLTIRYKNIKQEEQRENYQENLSVSKKK